MTTTLENIYNQRSKFSVVALTGVTGSGCTELAELMAGTWENLANKIRKPESIKDIDSKSAQVFKRKYERAYRYIEKNNKTYKVISYKDVVILETLILLILKQDKNLAGERFKNIILNLYKPSINDVNYAEPAINIDIDKLNEWGLNEIINKISQKTKYLDNWNENKKEWRQFIAKQYFSEEYTKFCDSLFKELKTTDYYLKNLFVHRLANSIRSFGNPEIRVRYNEAFKDEEGYYKKANMDNLFRIIGLINDIIKGSSHEDERNFVIDSLRSSLEIVYLRERYNAFYMIAMHNADFKTTIKKKIKKFINDEDKAKKLADKIYNIGIEEIKTKHYEEGFFSFPDVYNCIASSEIHIIKRDNRDNENSLEFYSTAEQWLKIQSLILHPGLFTPSSDERCMSIAYQVKFNSGCISRQVGCVITDSNYTIKSLGWNDVPYGQIPCELTDVQEFLTLGDTDKDFKLYSKFEQEGIVKKSNKTFKDHMDASYSDEFLKKVKRSGLYLPFCFKTCYNDFQKQKDNVNTRSLHAEENTMLQVCKNGGVGLNGGKMYVTASPCVLCSKKAYQIGIKEIIYLDKYTDIAEEQILEAGFDKPVAREFYGIVGPAYYKLYQPFMSYKDELEIRRKE